MKNKQNAMIMKPKTIIFLVLLGVFCQSLTAAKTPNAENKETLLSVQLAGGCCGPVNEDCGKCIPKDQMPNFETGYSCCLPVTEEVEEKKPSARGPQYWCCRCGYPALQPSYGQPCCAGTC